MSKKVNSKDLGKRITIVREILSLSPDEFSRFIDRSRSSLRSFENGIFRPSKDIVQKIIDLSKERNLRVEKDWLLNNKGNPPTSKDKAVQENITNIFYLVNFYETKKLNLETFVDRLKLLMKELNCNKAELSNIFDVSFYTINQWTMRKTSPTITSIFSILSNAKKHALGITPQWLLEGIPPYPTFNQKEIKISVPHYDEVELKIKTTDYEPFVQKNTTLFAQKFNINLFKQDFKGIYLFPHENSYIPVHLQPSKTLSSKGKGLFDIRSLNFKIADQIIIKNVPIDFIYPVIRVEYFYCDVKFAIAG